MPCFRLVLRVDWLACVVGALPGKGGLMRVGCALEMFAGIEPLEVARAIRSAGLREVEWMLPARLHETAEGADDLLLGDAGQTAAWLRAMEQQGLRVVCLRMGDRWAVELPELARFGRLVERATTWGVENVVIGTGVPRDETDRQRLLEGIAELADVAAEHGLTLALDTRPGLCGDSRSMRTTLSELNHDNARLCFDTGAYLALNVGSSVEVALQRVLGWVGCLRLTDHNDFDDSDDFPPFGLGGGVDFARLLQVLEAVAFAGVCVVSCRPARRRKRSGENPFAWLRDCLAHLDECGWAFDN